MYNPGGYTNISRHLEGVIHEGVIHESILKTLFSSENIFTYVEHIFGPFKAFDLEGVIQKSVAILRGVIHGGGYTRGE